MILGWFSPFQCHMINDISEVDDYVPKITYPSYLLHTIHHLEHLKLAFDERVDVVFEMHSSSNRKLATTRDSQHPLLLPYLKMINIYGCDGIEEVISSRDDENEENNTSTSSYQNTTFFPSLDNLTLKELLCLKSIDDVRSRRDKISSNTNNTINDQFQGVEVIGACGSLCQYPRKIFIENCDTLSSLIQWYAVGQMKKLEELEIRYCSTMVESKTPKFKYIQTSLGKHSPECGLNFRGTISEYLTASPTSSVISEGLPCSFHNLIEIDIEDTYVGTTIIPSNAMLQLKKLQQIHLKSCFEVKEVFGVALEGANNSGFNESQNIVKIPNLIQVGLSNVHGLKYLWKNNRWMALEFPNLTNVSIYSCVSLEYVFTCSMIGSLVQLKDLHISHCKNMEVIVKEEEEEESDAKVNQIMLPRLKSLKLYDLPSLNGFCLDTWKKALSFPALDTLQITSCHRITAFTSGQLATLS
ncbi:hypothetical protein L1987_88072 [Smallanthus sonchifolius]|nr:hypothetical protein L1987_88072 [Smallanthus sonchifolius]